MSNTKHDFADLTEAWAFVRAAFDRGDLASDPLQVFPHTVTILETAAGPVRSWTQSTMKRSCAAEGMPEIAILHLRRSLETLALGLANAHDTTYHVQVVL